MRTTAANATGPVTNKAFPGFDGPGRRRRHHRPGGLVRTPSGRRRKVPPPRRYPVVGGLFSYNSRKRSKTNLVIFLRPVILRDRDAWNLSADRYDYLIGEQKKQNADAAFCATSRSAGAAVHRPGLGGRTPSAGDSRAPDRRPVDRAFVASPVIPYVFARSQGHSGGPGGGAGLEVLSQVSTTASAMAGTAYPGPTLRCAPWLTPISMPPWAKPYAEGYGPRCRDGRRRRPGLDLSQLMHDLPAVEDLLDAQDGRPSSAWSMPSSPWAVREASDVHVEAFEKSSVVRFRRDGMMRDVAEPHPGASCGPGLADQDHGQPGHRRGASPGRPYLAFAWAGGR